jgi:hypothetical protein
MVGNWLYGVAQRTALEARRAAAKRRAKEAQVAPRKDAPKDGLADLRPLLDQELTRLPDKYRAVLVLCDLEGRTRKEAAQQLGLPEGSIASRQARARNLLAKRLTRQGVTLAGEALAASLAQEAASASAPFSLLFAVRAARAYAAGPATAATSVSAPVAALAEGVLRTMLLTRPKKATLLLLVVAVIGSAAAVIAHPTQASEQATGNKPAAKRRASRSKAAAIVRVPGVYTTAVGLTANGQLVATGGSDHAVRLWDAATGKRLRTLKGHSVAINCLAFSPNDRTLASATGDWVKDSAPGEVKLWDVATGKEGASVKGHAGFVMALAFSPDGKALASASNTVKVWDVATGKEIVEIPGFGTSVAFSPNTPMLAVGRGVGEDNTPGWVELWDTTTWKKRVKLAGHGVMITWVGFSPNGKTLASADRKGSLKLWDAATGKERISIHQADASFLLQPLAFTADGKKLVAVMQCSTAQGEGSVVAKVWEVARGKEQATYWLPPEKIGFFKAFTALSADGKTLAIGGFERLDQGKRPQSEWKINGVTAVWEVKSLPTRVNKAGPRQSGDVSPPVDEKSGRNRPRRGKYK